MFFEVLGLTYHSPITIRMVGYTPGSVGPLQLPEICEQRWLLLRGERAIPIDAVRADHTEPRRRRRRRDAVLLGEERAVLLEHVLERLRAVVDEIGRRPADAAEVGHV